MTLLESIGALINYFSVLLLSMGLLLNALQREHENRTWVIAYLSGILLTELIVLAIRINSQQSPIILFTGSFFWHFAFLTWFYCKHIFKVSTVVSSTLLVLGGLPFLLHYCTSNDFFSWLQLYARIPYSLIITSYSLGYFYALIRNKISSNFALHLLNGCVLLFFAVDSFLGAGMSYLIKRDHIELVAWFWFFRAFAIELFYIALIYYGWKSREEKAPIPLEP